jgi:hypothetical protein
MQGNRYASNSKKQQLACQMYREGATLDAIIKDIHLDFYRLRVALDREGLLPYPDEDKPADRCPCGKKTGVKGQKYCCWDHRVEYGSFRPKNPENWVTFNCLNCGKEVTRPWNYGGNSVQKYCSNECSAKHNRTKQHIVVEDAMVLDSPYEALFYGLMRMWKIPCERADRSQAVSVNGSGWYCPDFYLPEQDLWTEIKGFEEEDHRLRYARWRASGRMLAVLRREQLDALRVMAQGTQAIAYLEDLACKAVRL